MALKKVCFVTVIGETNSGKSTFINKIIGQKVSIVSRKIQTTVARVLGISIWKNTQIILIDTPGFARNRPIISLEKIAWDAFRETDDILFLVDAAKKNLNSCITILKKIDHAKKVSLILNKVDLVHKPKLLELASMFSNIRKFENIFMISSLTGSGIETILDYLDSVAIENEWIYGEDEITDMPFEKYVSEITREHIYHRLHQEIPYKCNVQTKLCENKEDGSIKIVQDIYVATKAHKVIVIGENASKIKAIGKASRAELSTLLEKKVHLFLHVLVD